MRWSSSPHWRIWITKRKQLQPESGDIFKPIPCNILWPLIAQGCMFTGVAINHAWKCYRYCEYMAPFVKLCLLLRSITRRDSYILQSACLQRFLLMTYPTFTWKSLSQNFMKGQAVPRYTCNQELTPWVEQVNTCHEPVLLAFLLTTAKQSFLPVPTLWTWQLFLKLSLGYSNKRSVCIMTVYQIMQYAYYFAVAETSPTQEEERETQSSLSIRDATVSAPETMLGNNQGENKAAARKFRCSTVNSCLIKSWLRRQKVRCCTCVGYAGAARLTITMNPALSPCEESEIAWPVPLQEHCLLASSWLRKAGTTPAWGEGGQQPFRNILLKGLRNFNNPKVCNFL